MLPRCLCKCECEAKASNDHEVGNRWLMFQGPSRDHLCVCMGVEHGFRWEGVGIGQAEIRDHTFFRDRRHPATSESMSVLLACLCMHACGQATERPGRKTDASLKGLTPHTALSNELAISVSDLRHSKPAFELYCAAPVHAPVLIYYMIYAMLTYYTTYVDIYHTSYGI